MQKPDRKNPGRTFRSTTLPLSVLGLGFAIAAPAIQAQSVLEETLVTAQRREENLQEVPVSVAAFSQEMLQMNGVNGTKNLPELAPSVQLVTSGPTAIFFVRGVGNTSAGTGEEGTNAFYVDGIFMPSLKQTAMKFNNIERVEVIKGPQGTLFGRNSSGGLVNVITRNPGDQFEAKVNVGFADYDTYNAQAYIGGPLSGTLGADLALTYTDQQDGWGKDQITGKDVGLGWDWGARSKWVWQPSDETRVSVSADYAKSSDNFSIAYRLAPESAGINLDPTGPLPPPKDPYDTNSPISQYSDLETYGINLTAEFDLGAATLTSITGARKGENHSFFDADMGPQFITHLRVEDSETSFQQELRLASNSDGPLSWQAGVFFLGIEAKLDPQTFYTLRGDYAVFATLDTTSYAAFGEVSYELTPTTTLIAGVRYTQDELEYDGVQVSDNPDYVVPKVRDDVTEKEPTYRLALRQDISDNINVYASYNTGYKSGTFPMSFPGQDAVKPQTIDAYEVGMKSELLDNRLRLNLSAFHYEISDYQVRSASGDNPVPILLNAAEVEVDGFELEFEAVPTDNLRLFGSASWLNSEFKDFPYAPFTYLEENFPWGTNFYLDDASGRDTPLAPDFAGNLGVSYFLPVSDGSEIGFSLLYSYNDGYFFEQDNRLKQPSFSIINASITYKLSKNWRVDVWGRNLEDETYYNQKLTVSRFGDAGIPAAPRTYGIGFEYNY